MIAAFTVVVVDGKLVDDTLDGDVMFKATQHVFDTFQREIVTISSKQKFNGDVSKVNRRSIPISVGTDEFTSTIHELCNAMEFEVPPEG